MDSSYRRVQSGDDKEREQVSTMEPVFLYLLILMAVAWTTAMMLLRISLITTNLQFLIQFLML